MRCKAAGFRYLRILRAAVVAVRENEQWIVHALHCSKCGVRDEALGLLFLAGVEEDEFIGNVWDRLVGGETGGAEKP